ncbi:hypothetical protein [Geminocystis sp. NIES-3709]|nr:hypothetical protein [Geminocystis sp. NIES-3709]BAQ66473.1 hypothetical protein GM3709_3238 [Geminocystis sp. NIES-3709]
MIYGGIGDVNISDIRKLITYLTIKNDVLTTISYDQEKIIKYLG